MQYEEVHDGGFDYRLLDEQMRARIDELTHEVNYRLRRTAHDAWVIGMRLMEIRETLGYRLWGTWLRSEWEGSRDTAERLIRIGRYVPQFPQGAAITLGALDVIAHGHVPQAVREEAVRRATEGRVTAPMARAMVDEALTAQGGHGYGSKKYRKRRPKDAAKAEAVRRANRESLLAEPIPPNRADLVTVHHGDFRDFAEIIADGSVDAVVSDPPYAEASLDLWEDFGRFIMRKLKPGGYAVAYSGTMFLPEVLDRLRASGLEYRWMAGIRHAGRHGVTWGRGVFNRYKLVPIFAKPPVRAIPPWSDEIDCAPCGAGGDDDLLALIIDSPPPPAHYHEWGQSEEAARVLIRLFSDPGDLILDCFAGGGSFLAAAVREGRRAIGIEINPEYAEFARHRAMLACPEEVLADD